MPATFLIIRAHFETLIHWIDVGTGIITGGTHVDAPERPKDTPAKDKPALTINDLKDRA